MPETVVSLTDKALAAIEVAAQRQGRTVAEFLCESALLCASMASDENPFPLRRLAHELQVLGAAGDNLSQTATRVAETQAGGDPPA
jgi:hypothetical protein